MGHHRIHDHAQDGVAGADVGGGREVHHRARRGGAGRRSRQQPNSARRRRRAGPGPPGFPSGTSARLAERGGAGRGRGWRTARSRRASPRWSRRTAPAWQAVVARCRRGCRAGGRVVPDVPVPAAAVVHAIEDEMAVHARGRRRFARSARRRGRRHPGDERGRGLRRSHGGGAGLRMRDAGCGSAVGDIDRRRLRRSRCRPIAAM